MQAIKNALHPLRSFGLGSIFTKSILHPSSAPAPTAGTQSGCNLLRNFSQLCSQQQPLIPKLKEPLLQVPVPLIQISTRNIIRCYFPRPSETKRIRRHGWKQRMSTKDGRRIIMKRILKNKYILSH